MDIRAYEAERDRAHVERIWREVGWITDDDGAAALPHFLDGGHVTVGLADGEAECCVSIHDATWRQDRTDLACALVSSVTTSWVGRRRGFAGTMLRRQLVAAAGRGDAVSVLGMFDQGFYDRLGFGTGASVLRHQFDPDTLRIDVAPRPVRRLGVDDVPAVHDLLQRRPRTHGGVVVHDEGFTRGEYLWTEERMTLGLHDEDGRLVGVLIGKATGEHGPLEVYVLVGETSDELLELVGLLRQLGDQYRLVWLADPPELVLEDLLDQPYRHRFTSKGAAHPHQITAGAWWQLRVLDLVAVTAALPASSTDVTVVVDVQDPLAAGDDGWDGVHGRWRLSFGAAPTAERTDAAADIVAGAGAVSRLLTGVAKASHLALSDHLDGPPDVLAALDDAITLPEPQPGMWF